MRLRRVIISASVLALALVALVPMQAQRQGGNPLSPDVRFVQNGPSMDGWTPAARGRRNSTEEPTIGLPDGRGRGRRGGNR